ncbi:MAG: hypothetical protein PVSMB5_19940 [Ktedonobacteraceae bacterium]
MAINPATLSEGVELALLYKQQGNAKAWGAQGNGTTDDTAAIQAAINAAPTTGGKIFLSPGTYSISTPLNITANGIMIEGAGPGATILQLTAGFVGAAAILVIGANDFQIRNMSVQAISATYSSNPSADGIKVVHSNRPIIEDLILLNLNGYGLQIISDATGDSLYPMIDDIHLKNCKTGIHLQGTASSDGLMNAVIGDIITENIQAGDGILIEDVVNVTADNFQGNTIATGNALHIKGASQNIFIANVDMGALVSGVASPTPVCLVETGTNGSPSNVSIENALFFGGSIGASVTAGSLITFSTCAFFKNGTHGLSTSGTAQVTVSGCIFNLNGFTAGAGHYDANIGSSGNIIVSANYFLTPAGSGSSQVAQAINVAAGTHLVIGNWFAGANAANTFNGTPTAARSNQGYNPPATFVTTPSVPASNTAIQNTTGVDCYVYILAGTITVIGVGATSTTTATGLTSSASGVTVFLPAGWYIKLTYSVAPTWVFQGV